MSQPESNVNYVFKCDKQLHQFAEELGTLYRREELCDTTLVAGADNVEVKTHRVVLYLSSIYFRTIFHSGLEDSKDEAIRLNTVDGETLKKVIGFMYTFEIEMTKESIEKVLSAANLLEMKTLVEGCCNLLVDQLNDRNCLRFVHLAAQHNYTTLYEKSLEYAFKNFKEVSAGEEFLKLTEPEVSKYLSQDGVNAVSQETLFLSLVQWLKHDQETRNESMYILLNDFVRFSQLDPEFIIQNAESVAHIAKCAKLLFSWLNWHSLEEKRKKQKEQEIFLSRETEKKPKIILAYNYKNVFKVDSYDPVLNKWSEEDWPQPSKMRRGYGIVITETECVIAGGRISYKFTNSVECLDFKTMKWRCLQPMTAERGFFEMAVLNGILYVVGGENKEERLRLLEKYDFTDDKWTTLAELPVTPITWLRVVPVGGKLYISDGGISHLMCYDPATNKWGQTSDKNGKSWCFGLTATDEYVYAVGDALGRQSVNTVERYNPSDNTWAVIESMPTYRNNSICLAVGDKLLVCGGNGAPTRRIFEQYNEKTKDWKHLAQCSETFAKSNYSYRLSDYISTIFE